MGQALKDLDEQERRTGKGDKPMRWAIGPNGKATHIFDIPKEKTGLKCECTCPGCHMPLQAVNAVLNDGSNAPVHGDGRSGRTMSQFFRHPAGQARSSCMQKASQLAALSLFQTQEIIDVPAPTSTQLVAGLSGRRYRSHVAGSAQRLTIRRTLWNDHQSAFLETMTGERILVILRSAYTGERDSECDGVITVECDDPSIAAMSIEELLDKVALSAEHTCWVKHWSCDSLAKKALEEAQEQAFEALDWIPEAMAQELGDVPLTSESLLHLVIKQIIAEAGYIVTPRFRHEIWYDKPYAPPSHRGNKCRLVTRPSKRIRLEKIRLEHWMPGMVPDIYCVVAHEKGSHDLLIEVKVTHGMSESKLELVRQKNMLCLEVDIALFSRHGKITRTALREEVLNNPDSKVWRHHPSITAQIAQAHREIAILQERAKEEFEQAEENKRLQKLKEELLEKEAQQYRISLNSLPIDELERVFIQAVHQLHLSYIQIGDTPQHFPITADAMAQKGHAVAREKFFTEPNGVISIISRVINASENEDVLSDSLLDDLLEMSTPLARDVEYLPLMLWAIKRYPLRHSEEQAQKLTALRKKVWDSIQEGEITYARSTRRDALISLLFPALKTYISRLEGTVQYAEECKIKKRAKEMEEHAKHIQRLYSATLDKLEIYVWADSLPSKQMFERLLLVHDTYFQMENLGVTPQNRRAEVIRIAYEEAQQGGSIRAWLCFVEEVNTKPGLEELFKILVLLQLVTATSLANF